ncbi:MAG: hypothetical protein CMJ81_24015 [Planctomycetaceae bacterium]|nr:hypothetical protein [Planctomycetaceae bacterium]
MKGVSFRNCPTGIGLLSSIAVVFDYRPVHSCYQSLAIRQSIVLENSHIIKGTYLLENVRAFHMFQPGTDGMPAQVVSFRPNGKMQFGRVSSGDALSQLIGRTLRLTEADGKTRGTCHLAGANRLPNDMQTTESGRIRRAK